MESVVRRAERAPVTIVLLNYDGGEKLERCLRSLGRQTILPEHLLFVDNGSKDFDEGAARSWLGSRFHELISFERLSENLGYARGMNHGLKLALSRADASLWLMTLSNDTEFDPEFFERLSISIESIPPQVRMLAPKLRAMDDRIMLDGAGIAVSLDGMSTARGQRTRDEGQFDEDPRILLPNGVAAIYASSLLREIGLFDDAFWCYCEDTDLGLRGWLAGANCRLLPKCIVYHARSSTLGEHSLKKLYLVERNHYWVALKNLPLPLLVLNPVFTLFRYAFQLYALAAQRGQGAGYGRSYASRELVGVTLRAMFDAAVGMPRALRKRFETRHLRKRTTIESLHELWRNRMSFADLILK